MSRVVLVGKGPPDRGGIAAYLQAVLASDLAALHDVRLLNLARDGTRHGGALRADNAWRTVADAVEVWRAARGADVVHVHSAAAPLVTMLRAGLLAGVARLAGSRTILHAHGGRVQLWLTSRWRCRLARAALAGAHRVIAVSEAGREALASALGEGRVVLVDNGVDVGVFTPRAGGHTPPRVLYVGGLTPRKGVLDLLEASAVLRRRGVAHELLLAGGTPDEGEAAEAEVRARAGPEAKFVGSHPHAAMPELYGQVDVLCLPSWWEAMPLSVLEAMASALPVVATAVGDVPRVVADGVTGLVVPPRDPHALAHALAQLLESPEMRRSMGEAARARACELFPLSRTLASLSELYEGREPLPGPPGTTGCDAVLGAGRDEVEK